MYMYMKIWCAELTWQMVNSCFQLVGPHQCRTFTAKDVRFSINLYVDYINTYYIVYTSSEVNTHVK